LIESIPGHCSRSSLDGDSGGKGECNEVRDSTPLLGLDESPHASTVELTCGGRVSFLQDSDGNAVLSVTTAPDTNGQTHAVAVPLSIAERAEIQQAVDVESQP
jgi:hypothetical protein